MTSPAGYSTKVTFLHKVTGNDIVQEQDKINCSDSMFVTATQIYPWENLTKKISDEQVRIYDAFIYYKVREKFGSIKIPENSLEDGKK